MGCCCSCSKGPIKVETTSSFNELFGAIKVRLGIGRMDYKVEPGLYKVGNPTDESPVLVTANYKLTFDVVRKNLSNLDVWLVVLDTKGVNVWCAAGKGTFGTEEMINRINQVELSKYVSHNKIVVPQLGAVGVAGYQVKKQTGFKVLWGPTNVKDIKSFIDNGFKCIEEHRKVEFPILERFKLVPLELVFWSVKFLMLSIVTCLLVIWTTNTWEIWLRQSVLTFGVLLSGYLSGGILGPLLLPWLPGRAFAIKGIWTVIPSLVLAQNFITQLSFKNVLLSQWGFGVILLSICSFMTMNFTGCSTYTSLSGVQKEMKIAIPVQFLLLVVGAVLIGFSGGAK
jgi:hypothetical protein